jgi:hypothetical protein
MAALYGKASSLRGIRIHVAENDHAKGVVRMKMEIEVPEVRDELTIKSLINR